MENAGKVCRLDVLDFRSFLLQDVTSSFKLFYFISIWNCYNYQLYFNRIYFYYYFYLELLTTFFHIQFLAYLSQHILLVGITLPLWAVNFHPGPLFDFPDYLSLVSCMVGLMISNVADRQLRIFMVR